MDSYTPFLEKTRVPQPSLQKLAVIAVFEKLRSAPPRLDPDSDPGRDAITRCLHSTSAAVVDQSTRELCRLVKDSKLDLPTGLLELQSALEATNPRFINLFIKAIGFLTTLGFQNGPSSFRFYSSEIHPFVKILSCGVEVHCELAKQVIIFMVKSKHLGMEEVCEFLRPFLNYSIIKVPITGSYALFVRNLVFSLASFCCLFPREAIPVFKLLIGCIKYFPCENAEEFTNVSYFVECLVDAYLMALRKLVGMGSLIQEAQLCGVALLEAILPLHGDFRHYSSVVENILDVLWRLLTVQKELGLNYITELKSVILSLFLILIQSELEHEQYSIAKLVLYLFRWKSENEYSISAAESELSEELLFIFPVVNLVSSPSISVKQVATDLLSALGKTAITLLTAPKEKQAVEGMYPLITTPGCIIFRLLRNLWFQDQSSTFGSYYIDFSSIDELFVKEEHCTERTWPSSLREYSLGIVGKCKSASIISQPEEIFWTEMPAILCAIGSVLLMHQKLRNSAVDLLAVCSNMEPKLGVPLLLLVLFYNHVFLSNDKDIDFHDTLLKLWGLLPSLASHPVMIPLIVQTIIPMLHKDAKPVLYATATRLICKTWEINDRVFGSLQGVLVPKGLSEFSSDREICISIAVSILDVCRRNPDRGVDLILTVAVCIENQDPLVQTLGLQSVAHLCEADVIDFYTAWDVIAKHVLNYLENATVAHGLCLLLRWGAMDAEAYPEASTNVLKILWEIGSNRHAGQGSLWTRARVAAFMALLHYEIMHIHRSIPDFMNRNVELFTSETDPEVLKALEEFEVKIINHEHITRRRFVKQKRVFANKIEKLLGVFPQVIFTSGSNSSKSREFPGAALFCLSFTQTEMKNQGMSKGLQDVHAKYKDAMVDIAASLQVSRNILVALLSLQSWKAFMQRWMRSCITLLDTKSHYTVLDRTSKAANDILKVTRQIAEESIPRSAENIALALGAFCLVLPASAHAVKSPASKFLLGWLFQYEHEYRQWSAAISLGLISSCLHVTDHKLKFEIINALIEVASLSKSTLVKGACGVGLGFSCQDLLSRVDAEENFKDKETHKMQEADLLKKIVSTLLLMICQFAGFSVDILKNLSACFPLGTNDFDSPKIIEYQDENFDNLEEDIWGISGLVLGLGNSINAIYRAGTHEAVLYLKAQIISWIPHVNSPVSTSAVSEARGLFLSVGSCLALPILVSFCQRVELIDDTELDRLLSGFRELITDLMSVERSDAFHQSLLMASCIGAGGLLSGILNAGLHSIEIERVKDLLTLFRRSYSSSHPPLVHLGGMLGVVNAIGAGAGTLVQQRPLTSFNTAVSRKESSYITGPLLSNLVLEPEMTSLIQEIFLVAQNSDDPLLQQYAAWTMSFLRHSMFSTEHSNEGSVIHNDSGDLKSISQIFAEDSVILQLSSWLMQMSSPEVASGTTISTVVSVLRCLSHAPRLPSLDWSAIIGRCMKYEGLVAQLPAPDSALRKGILREECLLFLLAHANQSDALLSFLDDLSDLARFKTLEPNLQSIMLLHVADLLKIFSSSRLGKLFDDLAIFLPWFASSDQYNKEHKISLRVSCWKGLCLCLNESFHEMQDYTPNLENCMEVLFTLLPWSYSADTVGSCKGNSGTEWIEAIRCLGKARQGWLLNLLLISDANFIENSHAIEILKKIQAKARLVRIGAISLNELGKLKAHMLSIRTEVIWDVLVEVAVTVQHAEGSAMIQWLIETVKISCVSSYPATALLFLGLLCGGCCKYMPVLILDRVSVLSDLPVTLSSLLSETSWGAVAESVASDFWASTERVYDWAKHIEVGDYAPSSQPIDRSENDTAPFLLQVMREACIYLKPYLPPEKLLRLANMVV
ncbi:Protein RST1 [Forsythia ovata]|uniref:Protein RST1 n=1 Tax=Forsythia ovata TaxID=205694 RepID=A0ABD1UV15_9LAMI